MKIKDLWLTLKGWDEGVSFELSVQRKIAIIISEVTNRTMGGKGVVEAIKRMFPLSEDKEGELGGMTIERVNQLLNARREFLRKKRDGGTT